MTKSESEIWKALPGVPGVEVSTLGRVRTLDKIVSSEKRTQFVKGHVLKQCDNSCGYLMVHIPIDGKLITKSVHRLIAKTFIPNPDNLPQINHKNCDRSDNCVINLEWCNNSYNIQYREKFGKALGRKIFAINLGTLEVSRFKSQHEAGRLLGISQGNINSVIKGILNKTNGYWFTNADENANDSIEQKLRDIKKTELKVK